MRSLVFGVLMLLMAAPAGAAWHEVTSDHFRIYGDEDAATVRAFAERLERFDAAMRFLRNLKREGSTDNKLTIFALSGRHAVSTLYGKGGERVGGWYTPRGDGSIAIVPLSTGSTSPWTLDENAILLHEYAHHFFFRNSAAAYPAWYVEGFAEFFSTAKLEKDGAVTVGIPPGHRAYELVLFPIPAAQLLGAAQPPRGERLGGLYAKGWLLTHYFTFNPERRPQFATYLNAINAGAPATKAAETFGDLKALDAELRRYVQQRTLKVFRIPPERITIGPIAVRQLSPAEDAMMDVHIRSRRGVDAAQAKAIVPLARRAAAPWPASAPVQTWLAEAELDNGNLAEAEAAAGRAIAADPKDANALYFHARVAEVRAARAAAADKAAGWAETRRRFAAANRADPDQPGPLIGYYRSFLAADTAPSRSAVAGLVRAYELAPEANGLRLLLARQALMDKEPANARAALAPIAFAPHGGELATRAAKLVALIDGGQTEGLLAAADAIFKGEAEAGAS